MPILYVARSSKLGRWASDVGLGKSIYKVGVAESDPKALAGAGWAGETDWTIVRKMAVEGLSEAEALDRLGTAGAPGRLQEIRQQNVFAAAERVGVDSQQHQQT